MELVELPLLGLDKEVSQLRRVLGHVMQHLADLGLNTDGRVFVYEVLHSRDLVDVLLDLKQLSCQAFVRLSRITVVVC